MVAIKDMKEIPKSCCDEDKLCPLFNEETGTCNGADTTMRRFPNCPLVEIEERKVGKWIEVWGEYDEWREHKCSICDFQEIDADRFNFCPNCGANMRGNKDDNDIPLPINPGAYDSF